MSSGRGAASVSDVPFRRARAWNARAARILFSGRGGRPILDPEGLAILRKLLAQLRSDPPELLVLESTLDGFFAAGADLRLLASLGPDDARRLAESGQSTFAALERLPFPTVALIDGACYGGGLDLSLACRFRFATPRSTFAHPGVKLGIVTGWGGTVRLPRLVGKSAALRIFATGEPVGAEEALRIGLVDAVASPTALRRRIRAIPRS